RGTRVARSGEGRDKDGSATERQLTSRFACLAAHIRVAFVTESEHGGARLAARGLRVGYDERVVISDLSVVLPDDSFTVIVGPNACGKSTLLRALARILKPTGGAVLLDGEEISGLRSKEVA